MTTSLAPSLQIKSRVRLQRIRELPVAGTITVAAGDRVAAADIVAKAELPGELHVVRIADALGIMPKDMQKFVQLSVGDRVEAGQIICERRVLWGLIQQRICAPVAGVVEVIAHEAGNICVRAAPRVLELHAHVDGKVVSIEPRRSVTIETDAAWVQGVFGIGGERRGRLHFLDCAAHEQLKSAHIPENCAELVLVGGMNPSTEVLHTAAARGAQALLTGSIDDAALRGYLGYELGVAITGDEPVPMTVVISEGFGNLALGERVIAALKPHAGAWCSVSGATQVRAGAIRPEIIVSLERGPETSAVELLRGLAPGAAIRLIRFPHFGKRAEVVELPEALTRLATGAEARVLRARLENGEVVTVPRANVELL